MKDYLWQMLSATQYLHAQHILHLDLRSENMMITEYNLLKVVDLGSAQSLHQEKVLPSESFKDYLETMGACMVRARQLWGASPGGQQETPLHLSCLPSQPQQPTTLLPVSPTWPPLTWAQTPEPPIWAHIPIHLYPSSLS